MVFQFAPEGADKGPEQLPGFLLIRSQTVGGLDNIDGADNFIRSLGKPLKSILEAQPNIPIYLAAIGPKNVALAAEIADGWLPIFFSPDKFD